MMYIRNQKGMTAISMMVIAALVGFVAMTAFKLYPAYYDDFAVATALKNMAEDRKLEKASPKDIRKSLDKRITVSGVSLAKDDVTFVKGKGELTINVNYEVRIPMFYNVDAVVVFDHSAVIRR